MKKLLLVTLSIQSLGVLANFLLTFSVAKVAGAEAQGTFALYKGIFDLQIAFFIFGLPSGLVYFINKSEAMEYSIFHLSWKYALVIFPILVGINAILLSQMIDTKTLSTPFSTSVPLASAATMMIVYGLFRAIYLTQDDGYRFSLLSILPSALLLVTIIYSVTANHISIPVAYLIAAIFALFSTWKMCLNILPKRALGPLKKLSRADFKNSHETIRSRLCSIYFSRCSAHSNVFPDEEIRCEYS